MKKPEMITKQKTENKDTNELVTNNWRNLQNIIELLTWRVTVEIWVQQWTVTVIILLVSISKTVTSLNKCSYIVVLAKFYM